MAKDWKKIAEASGLTEAPDRIFETLEALDRAFRPLAARLSAEDDIAVAPAEEDPQ